MDTNIRRYFVQLISHAVYCFLFHLPSLSSLVIFPVALGLLNFPVWWKGWWCCLWDNRKQQRTYMKQQEWADKSYCCGAPHHFEGLSVLTSLVTRHCYFLGAGEPEFEISVPFWFSSSAMLQLFRHLKFLLLFWVVCGARGKWHLDHTRARLTAAKTVGAGNYRLGLCGPITLHVSGACLLISSFPVQFFLEIMGHACTVASVNRVVKKEVRNWRKILNRVLCPGCTNYIVDVATMPCRWLKILQHTKVLIQIYQFEVSVVPAQNLLIDQMSNICCKRLQWSRCMIPNVLLGDIKCVNKVSAWKLI